MGAGRGWQPLVRVSDRERALAPTGGEVLDGISIRRRASADGCWAEGWSAAQVAGAGWAGPREILGGLVGALAEREWGRVVAGSRSFESGLCGGGRWLLWEGGSGQDLDIGGNAVFPIASGRSLLRGGAKRRWGSGGGACVERGQTRGQLGGAAQVLWQGAGRGIGRQQGDDPAVIWQQAPAPQSHSGSSRPSESTKSSSDSAGRSMSNLRRAPLALRSRATEIRLRSRATGRYATPVPPPSRAEAWPSRPEISDRTASADAYPSPRAWPRPVLRTPDTGPAWVRTPGRPSGLTAAQIRSAAARADLSPA